MYVYTCLHMCIWISGVLGYEYGDTLAHLHLAVCMYVSMSEYRHLTVVVALVRLTFSKRPGRWVEGWEDGNISTGQKQ